MLLTDCFSAKNASICHVWWGDIKLSVDFILYGSDVNHEQGGVSKQDTQIYVEFQKVAHLGAPAYCAIGLSNAYSQRAEVQQEKESELVVAW